MRILGIDPGSSRIGYGLIEYRPGIKLIEYGICENKEKTLANKLISIHLELGKIITKTQPDVVSIEKIFFSNNQKTAIEVSHARGVIMLLLTQNNIPIIEIGPKEVKMAVTGYGLSDKQAVAKMVKSILKIKEIKGYDDVSDALAIAIAIATPNLSIDKLKS